MKKMKNFYINRTLIEKSISYVNAALPEFSGRAVWAEADGPIVQSDLATTLDYMFCRL